MSNREIVIDIVKKLPANTSLEKIAREIEFVAGVKRGLAQAKRRQGVSPDEARRRVKKWISKSSLPTKR
jgi:hypothetical protein